GDRRRPGAGGRAPARRGDDRRPLPGPRPGGHPPHRRPADAHARQLRAQRAGRPARGRRRDGRRAGRRRRPLAPHRARPGQRGGTMTDAPAPDTPPAATAADTPAAATAPAGATTEVAAGAEQVWRDPKRYLWALGLVVPLLPFGARSMVE